MKKYLQKKSSALAIFVVASIICEVITFLMLGFGFMPTYFLIPLAMILIVASAMFIIPGHIFPIILYSVMLLFQCVISITNIILYKIQGDVFTMDLLKSAGEAIEAMAGGFKVDFSVCIPFALLFIVAIAGFVVVSTRKERENKASLRRHGAVVLACVSVLIGAVSLVTALVQIGGLSKDGERNIFGVSIRENFDSFKFKVPYFRAFGTYSLVYKNILLNASPAIQLVNSRSLDETRDYFNQAEEQTKFEYYSNENGEACFEPDKGNNLITILLESFEDFMIHPEYTPALYNLQQKSIIFDNFHALNKTDVSEASVIFGSYPALTSIVPTWEEANGRYTGDTSNPHLTKEFAFSMPSVLNQQGYGECNYFHNSKGTNYSRSYTHPTYGFDGAYFLEDFEIGPAYNDSIKWRNDWDWHVPEKDFFEQSIDLILPENQDKPFFSFITTINSHGTYVLRENLPEIYYEKFDLIDDADYALLKAKLTASQYMNFKIALSKAMVADDGIAYLLEQLDERGMADNTTILAFADHNAYGNNLSYNVKQSGRTTSFAHKIPAFLYSPKIAEQYSYEEPLVVNKFMMHFDLVPTVLDILGIEINPRMYLGFHAFDERENIIISKLGLIFNDKIMTDGMDILWSHPNSTAEDTVKFRNMYLDLLNRWSFVNNLYSPLFIFQSDFDGDSLLQ